MKKGYKCILAVVNSGFSESAMEAAKACGARGGTILHGRGTASKEAEKIFNITIQPEKEIVMILAKTDNADAILKGLYTAVGTLTKAQGIVFALPVDEAIGLDAKPPKAVEKEEPKSEKSKTEGDAPGAEEKEKKPQNGGEKSAKSKENATAEG